MLAHVVSSIHHHVHEHMFRRDPSEGGGGQAAPEYEDEAEYPHPQRASRVVMATRLSVINHEHRMRKLLAYVAGLPLASDCQDAALIAPPRHSSPPTHSQPSLAWPSLAIQSTGIAQERFKTR